MPEDMWLRRLPDDVAREVRRTNQDIVDHLEWRRRGVLLGEVGENPAVQADVVLLQVVRLLLPVQEYAEARELLESLRMPARPAGTHLREDVVDERRSGPVHPFASCLVASVLTVKDTGGLRI